MPTITVAMPPQAQGSQVSGLEARGSQASSRHPGAPGIATPLSRDEPGAGPSGVNDPFGLRKRILASERHSSYSGPENIYRRPAKLVGKLQNHDVYCLP